MSGITKYKYTLTEEEKVGLQEIISSKRVSHEKRTRAYILIKCDEGNEAGSWEVKKIQEAYSVSESKIYNTRKRMVEEGLESALCRKEREFPPKPRKLDGEKEARLISIACSEAPTGYKDWTLGLLANKLVQLGIVESISKECVRKTLKKIHSNLG